MFTARFHRTIQLLSVGLLLLCGTRHARAQAGMADLFAHTYWVGYGSRDRQYYGAGGISYLGRLNDTIPNALAISEVPVRSSLVLNRFPGDTARVYEFPGQTVLRGNFNGDSAADFFCWDAGQGKITILLGTEKIDSFRTAVVIQAPNPSLRGSTGIVVADLDSSGCDDVLMLDNNANRALLFKGSVGADSIPVTIIPHVTSYNGYLSVGRVRDRTHRYVCESNTGSGMYSNKAWIMLYPLGPEFTFARPSDSVLCTLDTSRYYRLTTGFNTMDVDGDSVDDFLLSGYDTNYLPGFKVDGTVFVYKGGEAGVEYPSYYFHCPSNAFGTFGTRMIDVGDVTGHGYHSLLVSDPEALDNGGAIFLYNMGKALKDSCVGVALPPYPVGAGYTYFGSQVVALPSLDSSGRRGFMTSDAGKNYKGGVYIFTGSPAYGPVVGVEEGPNEPTALRLAQNYPEPFATWTVFSFALPALESREARLEVFDLMGRKVGQLYRGPADGRRHVAVWDGSGFPSGTYVSRLACGARAEVRLLRIAR